LSSFEKRKIERRDWQRKEVFARRKRCLVCAHFEGKEIKRRKMSKISFWKREN